MSDGPTRVPVESVLSVFERRPDPHAPLTAPEVAEELGCARRTAHAKLEALTERGDLRTKKVGARGRVWWPAPERTDAGEAAGRADRGDGGDRTEHERALRELHDASRRLIRAETREEVCEVAVEAARRVLGLPLNGLWLYDAEAELLEPVAWSEEGVEQFGEPPSFPVDGSLVGRVFREGTHRLYDDVTAEAEAYDPETRVRSELVLPLGEYGVMNASSLEVGAFDEVDVSLGRVLAANVETAIERADRLAERRARRRELERQRDELRRLNQLNALVEEIIRSLVGAATREEIERTVCEALGSSASYVDAWILERGADADGLVRRAGSDGGVPPGAQSGSDGEDGGPVRSALRDGSLRVVSRLATDERVPAPLREAAVEAGARSCLVAPLAYADTVFGALVVHAPAPDAFSEREATAFETLGRVVGFVINATNNRRLLLGNTAVEVEFALDPSDAWFTEVSRDLGATVAVSGVVPTEGGSLLEYATVEGAPIDAAREALAGTPAVEEARVLADDGDRCSFECAVPESAAGLRVIAEYGASLRTARAVDGSGTVTARFPAAASAREATTAVEERFDGAELLAKRVVDVSDRSVPTVRRRVIERLTDKQLSALRAAFLADYYGYPRGTTAEDLAASLDIAPSTLHQHLQAAQRKLLATVLDGS
ncbi:MAG: bacterio-opsin activator domain-containing protein [Haloarculaceae archaeon]